MKTYKTICTGLCVLLISIGLLSTTSFTTFNACDYADSGIRFIKVQTETALNAKSMTMLRFFSGKALKSLHRTKLNFVDCGCTHADRHLDLVEQNLELAIASKAFVKARQHLQIVVSSSDESIDLLEAFSKVETSYYGDDILTLNTKTNMELQGGIPLLAKAREREQQVERSLEDFKLSLEEVLRTSECEEAYSFLNKVYKQSRTILEQGYLNDSKKYYHERVMQISGKAMMALEGCPTK